MVAISTDDLSGASQIATRLGIPFPILYDPSTAVPSAYSVFALLRDGLAAPATFVIDQGGDVRWRYVGRYKADRPSSGEVIRQLQRLQA